MQVRFPGSVLFTLVALCGVLSGVLCLSTASFAQIGVAIIIGPPPLPVYEQPACPAEGFLWTPGYWAYDYDFDDFYWIPGTWVHPPEIGFLWTPAYWGWSGDRFVFYDGYWSPHVGFYGGINYGFGYFGTAFEGGHWENKQFFYNTAVTNVNTTEIHAVYNTPVVNNIANNIAQNGANNGAANPTANRISYNGGNGGINARPSPEDEAAARERHIPPVAAQAKQLQQARTDPQQRASVNMGKPLVAATPKPGEFKGPGVAAAKEAGGPFTPPAHGYRRANQPRQNAVGTPASNVEPGSAPAHVVHPRDLPALTRPSAPATGNSKLDRKLYREEQKEFARQEKERDKLQRKQDKEDQRLAKRKVNEAQKQQTEQRHEQETQQLQLHQDRERQQMQEREQRAAGSHSPR